MKAILLVPAPEWREKLLGDGPCGARVPTAWRPWHEDYGSLNGGTWGDEWVTRDADGDGSPEEESAALVLAWEGAIAREGMDRLDWCLHGDAYGIPGRVRQWNKTPEPPAGFPDALWMAWQHAHLAAADGLGTVVVLP